MSTVNDSSLVVKSNQIIEASYNLPLNGHRLLSLVIASIPKGATSLPKLKMDLSDIAKTIPALQNNKRIHQDFEDVMQEVMDATITLREGDGWIKYNWVTMAAYKAGTVYIKLNDDLLPYLTSLIDRFTAYELKYVTGFRTAAQFRIYDLCKQYEGIGERKISVEDLRSWLAIPDDQYKQVGHLKSRILKPAIKGITQTSDIEITLGADLKHGRKTTGIHFVIQRKRQQALELDADLPDTVKKLVSLGITMETAQVLLNDFGDEYVTEKIEYVEQAFGAGKIKNLAAFAVSAIKGNYETKPAQLEEQNNKKKANLLEKRAQKQNEEKNRALFREKRVADFISSLTEQQLANYQQEFISADTTEAIIKKFHKKDGFSHQAVKAVFNMYMLNAHIPEEKPEEYEEFLKRNHHS